MADLLPVDEAQARLLALAAPLPVERVAVELLAGRTLAEPLLALRTQPAVDLSAMDGYAVPPGSLAGPWQVVGESAAGHPYGGTLQPGQAVRIATGAALPAGAGAVVMQEDLARDGDRITVTGTPPDPPARHIRRAGLDYAAGTELLPAGTRIGPAQLALAIGAGHAELPVHRLPRLAIIDSGDELVRPGEPCAPHQLPASNGAMLAAMAAPLAGTIERLGPVGDSMAALAEALARADHADVVVTSGGASVGDHDLIRPALARWGAELDFWKVAIRPGKPLMVARRGRQLVVGLPGNPVSSFVTAYLFVLPVLRALAGAVQPLPRPVPLRLTRPLGATAARREYVRAVAEGDSVTPADQHDSGALASLALANALIERPAQAPAIAAGEVVLAYRLENGGVA
ncbi:MAG: molybdopterin molybdotransferase MoeA [Proteobacteria bacterium]|nr:molybdopterin molybdotransferase MoeA [Pseudomonadota bacterium]